MASRSVTASIGQVRRPKTRDEEVDRRRGVVSAQQPRGLKGDQCAHAVAKQRDAAVSERLQRFDRGGDQRIASRERRLGKPGFAPGRPRA